MLAHGKDYMQSMQSGQPKRVLSVLILMLAFSMFILGRWTSPTQLLMQQTMAGMKLEVMQQQDTLRQLAWEQETNINALAVRLAELKAASTRLDALGERLVKLGQLDPEEFDFSQAPPVGGPERVISNGNANVMGMGDSINRMSQVLHSSSRGLMPCSCCCWTGTWRMKEHLPAGPLARVGYRQVLVNVMILLPVKERGTRGWILPASRAVKYWGLPVV